MKGTKRALIASAACTLLCGLLLFSTSIAWFTASRESRVNELYAGNLDIELSYSKTMKENNWKLVTAETDDIFKVNVEDKDEPQNMLWEPGAVNVVYFKIENKGSLAAKYDFALEIAEEIEGTNFNEAPNNKFKLSNYIYGGVKEVSGAFEGETEDEKRNAAITAISENEKTLSTISGTPLITGEMNGEAHPNEKTFALVLYMPDNTGDVTNYKTGDGNKPILKLKIKLVATQDVGEADSFGDQYDKGAVYTDVTATTPTELTSAIGSAQNGAVIGIGGNDLELTGILNINNDITIVGDGVAAIEKFPTYVGANNTVTFKNVKFDDTTSLEKATSVYGQGFKGTVIFDGCTFGNNNWEAIQITPAGDCTIVIRNCTFDGPSGARRYIHIQPKGTPNDVNNNHKLDVTVTNCTFKNCDKITANGGVMGDGAVIDFDYFAPGSTITMGGNQFLKSDNSEATEIKPYFCSTGNSGYPNAIEGGNLITYLKGNVKTYSVTDSGLTEKVS